MASDDGCSLLEIPGAWISRELDLDLSPPASLTPPPSKQPAYIGTPSKESLALPPRCDPLPPSPAPIVVRPTPRALYPILGPHKSDHRAGSTFIMPVGPITTAEATPQSVLSLFGGASNASSPLPSPIGVPPLHLPGKPTETLLGDTTSVHSGVSGLYLGPPGSPLSKCSFDSGFPVVQDDFACKAFASRDSLDCSVIDAFPSSASINLGPPIPPIASDLHLRNFPISDESSLEPHSVYFSAVEGDLSISRGSDDGPEHVRHEADSYSGSALDLCIPSTEEALHQTSWQENPSPRRPTVRIEVRNDVFRRGAIRRESFTYACKSLPYDAGFRPHAYVDNHEHTDNGKHADRLDAMAEDLYAMEEFMEEEDHVTDKSKPSKIFRKLVEGKRMSKLMTFGSLKWQKTPKRSSALSCVPDLQSSDAFPSVSNSAGRTSVAINHPNNPDSIPTPSSSPPPSYPIPDKKKHRTLFRKTRSGSQQLSIFVIPKPKVEGRVVPSPRELPMCLPDGEDPPPLSPLMSPQVYDADIPQTDVHGRSYGPSRVASPDLSSRSPDPPILGRKERRFRLTNIRSPKNGPLVA